MPSWTLKTPHGEEPKEILRFLQELVQYMRYITAYLDEENVPMLKNIQEQLKDFDLTLANVDSKYAMAFAELEEWKARVEVELNLK